MIAEIVPRVRLTRKLASFDYLIPPAVELHIGDVVSIPWRKKNIPGLVVKIKKTSTIPHLKKVNKKILLYSLHKAYVDAIFWFAKNYYISPALSFKTWLPDVPQKKSLLFKAISVAEKKLALSIPTSGVKKIQSIVQELTHKSQKPKTFMYSSYKDNVAVLYGLIRSARGKVLIIAPTVVDVRYLCSLFSDFSPIALHHDLNKAALWDAWEKAHCSEHVKLIIGTKTALFTFPDDLEYLIIDQEHSVHHKNYDQNPRYSVHDIAYYFFRSKKQCNVIFTSHAPRVTTYHATSPIVFQQPLKGNYITVDMLPTLSAHTQRYISSELEHTISRCKKILLFVNRVGVAKFLVCSECRALFEYGTVTQCTHCHNTHLYSAGFGTQKIASEIQKMFPLRSVCIVDRNHPVIPKEYDILIASEYIFDKIPLSQFNVLTILDTDRLLTRSEWRAHEKMYQLLTLFFTSHHHVLIQTFSPEHHILKNALSLNYTDFYKREFQTRKFFQYPPISRIVKIIMKFPKYHESIIKNPSENWLPPENGIIDIDPDTIF